ncbi:hypothetical protein EV360DRAFT_88446 [Lentinula raphanica]|nr:hypothetical protein EV360DRAFT_88446 [Lentinula raphanica]
MTLHPQILKLIDIFHLLPTSLLDLRMPAHRFAILTTFENPNATTRVIFPALLGSPMACKVPDMKRTSNQVASPEPSQMKRQTDEILANQTSNQVASPEPRQMKRQMDEPLANGSPNRRVADLNRPSDQVASPEPRQMKRQTDEVFANQGTSPDITQEVSVHMAYGGSDTQHPQIMATIERHSTALPRQFSATHHESNVPQLEEQLEDESISWAIRTRRQSRRQNPYPTRSKRLLQDLKKPQTSSPQTSSPHSSSSLCGRSSASTTDPSESLNQTQSSSPNDTRAVQAQSSFGYTAFDFQQRKVKSKDFYTCWYTYSTPFPIDHPPELPHNAMLQDNVIFLHIDEAQRANHHHGQLSKLLKYCCMWIWNGGSSKWEKISVGERRIINGYELCLALRYQKTIYLQWMTLKAFKALIAESS